MINTLIEAAPQAELAGEIGTRGVNAAGLDAAGLNAAELDTAVEILCQAQWPQSADDAVPQIAGFIISSFNPLVAEAAERCLRLRPGRPPAARTAILLASHSGDRATARAVAEAVSAGRRVAPLLFFQSNPNAVLGHIAARWGLTGPVVAVGRGAGTVGPTPEVLAEAALLLRDGDADEVLVIVAEQGATPEEGDSAVAVLVALRH